MEAIKQRRSVRNFTGQKLTDDHKIKLTAYINNEANLIGPFGNTVRIIYKEVDGGNKSEKIGTYGFIKNAPAFLITICKNDKESLFDLGYIFENLVLYLQTMGIGTCWLGGTFSRKKLQLNQNISENEFIPIISPIGYSAKKLHLLENIIRKAAKSNVRKPFDQLFFKTDFNTKISDSLLRNLLEYVRLAPSASNKQPWRILINDSHIAHFFIERSPNYEKSLGYDIQMVDIGIALAHYTIMSSKTSVFKESIRIKLPNENYNYLFSVH